jgi:PAS domain S-box-containing protein
MVNPAFTNHTDFTHDEVVGRTAQELGFWRDHEDRERMVATIESEGFIDNMEASFCGKGGKPMTCLVSSRAVAFGDEIRILSTVLDVTEQRKAEEALRKLDRAKSNFISTAAHELRTPLVAIVGYSELLEKSDNNLLTEEQKDDYLSIIQSNAENLNLLVDDLLDVGRIQIGRSLGVVLKENQIAVVLEKIAVSMRVRSQLHNIVIEHVNAPPQIMRFDSGRITQVFYNLLSNAIKYSPLGGTIKIQTITDDDKIMFSVIDQGQGMTLLQVEHVFDRFYRGDSASAETGGLGLGMSIVKQIVGDHGGEICVDSTYGEGTTVTFSLPLKS